MTPEHEWETVRGTPDRTTDRMRVPGGWIYLVEAGYNEETGFYQTAALTFVPEPPKEKP